MATKSPAWTFALSRALNVVKPAQSRGAASMHVSSFWDRDETGCVGVDHFCVTTVDGHSGVRLVGAGDEVPMFAVVADAAVTAEKSDTDPLAG
jgi:hypothetical protein